MRNTGEEFEGKVLNILNKALDAGELGLLASSCKVFSQKGYFSRDREKNIKTDISIELYVAKATEPSIIWVWECKDYKKYIPVDDVEEFHAKLEQIGADKTKGTIITSLGAFQDSSIKYAKSKGIGLARLLPEDQINWVMYQMLPGMFNQKKRSLTPKALSQLNYIAENQAFFGLTIDSKLTIEQSFREYIQYEINHLLQETKK